MASIWFCRLHTSVQDALSAINGLLRPAGGGDESESQLKAMVSYCGQLAVPPAAILSLTGGPARSGF
jgi:hypothetical protein